MIKKRPIVFNAEMVNAILDGQKTQHRKIINPQPPEQPKADCHPRNEQKFKEPYLDAYCNNKHTKDNPRGMSNNWCWWQVDNRQCLPTFKCPFGCPGDRLYVKEAIDGTFGCDAEYCADGKRLVDCIGWDWVHKDERILPCKKIPPQRMPRWASRITLEITNVTVEKQEQFVWVIDFKILEVKKSIEHLTGGNDD